MPVTAQLCVVGAVSCRCSSDGLPCVFVADAGHGCYRCSRHLYRWSTNGISAVWVSWSYESPSPLCDVLCEVPLGCRVRWTVLSPEFLTVRRTLSCPWSPSGILGCAFRGRAKSKSSSEGFFVCMWCRGVSLWTTWRSVLLVPACGGGRTIPEVR